MTAAVLAPWLGRAPPSGLSGRKSCQEPPLVPLEQRRNPGGGTGSREKEPLKLVDARGAKDRRLVFQFDTFRGHLEIERGGECDGRLHKAMDAPIGDDVDDQRAVE